MASQPIPKINDQNEVIGETTITEARQNGWPRRVTRIFIFNKKNQVLLQKRSAEARIHPNVWDCSGGHVDLGETYMEAGVREVREELAVEVTPRAVSEPVYHEHTFYVACVAQIKSDTQFSLKLNEVTEVKWVAVDELLQLVKLHPNSFTPWVVHAWSTLQAELIGSL